MYIILFWAFKNSRFPFDCENLPEYLIAVMIQYAMTRYTFVVVAAGAALATGGFLLAISIIEEIKIILKSVNKEAKLKKNNFNVLIRISDFIRIHSTLKQLSCESHNSPF